MKQFSFLFILIGLLIPNPNAFAGPQPAGDPRTPQKETPAAARTSTTTSTAGTTDTSIDFMMNKPTPTLKERTNASQMEQFDKSLDKLKIKSYYDKKAREAERDRRIDEWNAKVEAENKAKGQKQKVPKKPQPSQTLPAPKPQPPQTKPSSPAQKEYRVIHGIAYADKNNLP